MTTRDLVNHLLSSNLQFLILLSHREGKRKKKKATQTAKSVAFSLNMEEMYRTLQALTWAQIFHQTVSLKRSRRGLKPLFTPHVQRVMCLLDRFLIHKLPSLLCSSRSLQTYDRIWHFCSGAYYMGALANIYFLVCIVKVQNGARIPSYLNWTTSFTERPSPSAVLQLCKIIPKSYETTSFMSTLSAKWKV